MFLQRFRWCAHRPPSSSYASFRITFCIAKLLQRVSFVCPPPPFNTHVLFQMPLFCDGKFWQKSIARPFLSASSIRTFQPAQFFGFSHSIVCRHASSEVSSVCFPQLPASTHAATLYFAWHSVCHFLRGGYVCICRPS